MRGCFLIKIRIIPIFISKLSTIKTWFKYKTVCLKCQSHVCHRLYGILDPVTRDWTDGVLSNIFREINRPTEKKERRYIMFDGDVDALWVENMNSVMDDNKASFILDGRLAR